LLVKGGCNHCLAYTLPFRDDFQYELSGPRGNPQDPKHNCTATACSELIAFLYHSRPEWQRMGN
jgi:hypothetical protein